MMTDITARLPASGPPVPVLIRDTREQRPLVFTRLPCKTGCLQTGDYSIEGFEDAWTIERKTVADLVSSVIQERPRFERELARMDGYTFKRLLVVGTLDDIRRHRYRSRANPKSVLASVFAFEVRYGLPCVFATTPEEAALLVEGWAFYFVREQALTNPHARARDTLATQYHA